MTERHSTPTVLHFDDEVDTRELFASRLERDGYRVLSAATPAETLQLARKEHPSVIVLDLVYHHSLDQGIDLLRQLRNGTGGGDARVLVYSQRFDDAAQKDCAQLGVDAEDYVVKPELDRCLTMIRSICPLEG